MTLIALSYAVTFLSIAVILLTTVLIRLQKRVLNMQFQIDTIRDRTHRAFVNCTAKHLAHIHQ